MTYRACYRDGIIIPSGDIELPNGAMFSFNIVDSKPAAVRKYKKKASKKSGRKSPSQMTADERVSAFMAGFGILRDVPEWEGKSTVEIARELRKRALGNWGEGRGSRRG